MYASSPLYSVPIYSPYTGATGSTSSIIASLLSGKLHTIYEHLIWARPIDPGSMMHHDLYLCSGAYGTWYRTGAGEFFPTGEALPHQLFLGCVLQPPNRETRILSSGVIYEGAPSYGALIVSDPREDLVDFLYYRWKNAKITHYMGVGGPSIGGAPYSGPYPWKLNQFAEVFSGYSTALVGDSGKYTINLQDAVAILQSTSYQTHTYGGYGPCPRFDGSSGYASGSVPAPSGSMTIGVRIRSRAAISSNKGVVGWYNGSNPGMRYIHTDTTNAVTFTVGNNAGVAFTVSIPSVLAPVRWSYLWFVLDISALRMIVYDGDHPDTPIGQGAVSGSFTAVNSVFALARNPNTAGNYLPGDLDEISIWSKALSQSEIATYSSQKIQSGAPNLAYLWECNEGDGTTLYEAAGAGLNLTFHGGVSWVDSLAGDDSLRGKYIPKGVGIRRKIPLVPLSLVDLIYQVAEEYDSIIDDALGPILEDAGKRVWTRKGVYMDPWAATPAPGEYMEIPSLGLVRLGSSPTGQLTADANLTLGVDLPSCITSIVIDTGALTSNQVDLGSLGALPTVTVGAYAGLGNEPIKVDTLLIYLLRAAKGWRAGNVNLAGQLGFGTYPTVTDDTPPTDYLTADEIVWDSMKEVFTLPAAKNVSLGYRQYVQTQDYANTNPTLTPAARQDLGQGVRTVLSPVSAEVLEIDPSAGSAYYGDTPLDLESEALALVQQEGVYRSLPRRTDTLELVVPVPRFVVGQVISVRADVLDYGLGKIVVVSAVITDDGRQVYGLEVTGRIVEIGGGFLLAEEATGDTILTGDGSGSIAL
jgi:hypothetical protein